MRVLHLLPHTEAVDGIQRAALDLSRGLAESGQKPTLLALRHGNNTAAWEEVAQVRPPAPFLACSPRAPISMARTFLLARALEPCFDVVVAHRLDLLNAGATISSRLSKPLVFHAHNGPPSWLRWGDPLRVPGTRAVERVVVASSFMAEAWRDTAAGVTLRVVPYPIDTEHFHLPSSGQREIARAEAGVEPGQFVVGFVGRLEENKGPHILATAVRRMHEKGGRVRIVIQGAPGLGVSAADATSYRHRCVECLGACPVTWVPASPDVRPTIAASDVCAVPSIWPEPSGLTVAEALATGTPVVASEVGGIPEQLPAARHARLVPAADAGALYQALEALRAEPPGYAERLALREHIEGSRLLPDVTARYVSALTA
jgi:glycosyltransferase involved in cell wall biosynthesis